MLSCITDIIHFATRPENPPRVRTTPLHTKRFPLFYHYTEFRREASFTDEFVSLSILTLLKVFSNRLTRDILDSLRKQQIIGMVILNNNWHGILLLSLSGKVENPFHDDISDNCIKWLHSHGLEVEATKFYTSIWAVWWAMSLLPLIWNHHLSDPTGGWRFQCVDGGRFLVPVHT